MLSYDNPNHRSTRIASKLRQPELSVIDMLNRLSDEYPEAISLASGRPSDEFCTPEIAWSALSVFEAYARDGSRVPVNRLIGQYGPTSGIIKDILVRHLAIDEGICDITPDDIVVTVGFQEAAALCVATLFEENDVLLVPDPVFVGITGIAKLFGCNVWPVPCDDELDVEEVYRAISAIRAAGLNPRALYVIPDFSNPQGTCMSRTDRECLLEMASSNNMLIFEDGAYSAFRYEGKKLPPLKALDKGGCVIYIGTFSKTVFPGVRVGYLIANQTVAGQDNQERLTMALCKAKSFVSVNTSPLNQALIGGLLLQNGYSLIQLNAPKVDRYRANRDIMIRALENAFHANQDSQAWVTWNTPQGGFFITVTLPFFFTNADLEVAASSHGVIVFPVSLFSSTARCARRVRLAFTNVSGEQLTLAVERFADFVRKEMCARGSL
jgi:(S)-3,5-dihydroxyphenylglycine transaminase